MITNFDNLKQSGLCRRLKIFFPKIENCINYVEKTWLQKLEFLCGTFMIDHMACFLEKKLSKKPPIFMGSCGRIEKTGKNHKKMYTRKFQKMNLHLHRTKSGVCLMPKSAIEKNNSEENIISLDIYWNNLDVICLNLF